MMQGRPDRLEVHLDRWEMAQEGRAYWTREAQIDLKYLAGKTWTTDQLEQFRLLDQEPINYNLIHQNLRLIEGIEATTRADGRYLPKAPGDTAGARAATALGLKVWRAPTNQGARRLSRATSWAARVGVGYLKVRPATNPRAERISIADLNPFDCWPDPCHRADDMADAIDFFIGVWTYPTRLAAMFPEHRGEIMRAAGCMEVYRDYSHSADWTNTMGDRPHISQWQEAAWRYDGRDGVDYFNGRMGYTDGKQVQAVERWYRQDIMTRIVRMKTGRVHVVTPENTRMLAEAMVDGLVAEVSDRPMPFIRQAIFIGGTDIQLTDRPSDHSHGAIPIVKVVAYEDEHGRPMGVVRQARSPQKGFNAKIANLTDRINSRQVHYEADAFTDIDEAARALADPNGMVEYRSGALAKGKVKFRSELESTPVEGNMLALDQKVLADMTGVTQEMLGQETNAKSGKAIQERQEQGQLALYTLLDSRNHAQEQLWRLMLSDIQDLYHDEEVVRLRETASGIEWLNLKQRDPNGTILNDFTQADFDTEVSRAPGSANDSQRALDALMEFAAPMPIEIKLALLPNIAKLANLPDPEETVQKVVQVANALLARSMMGGLPMGEAQSAGVAPPQDPGQPGQQPTPPPGDVPMAG